METKKVDNDCKSKEVVLENPLVTWETSNEGKKIPIVIFNCLALSKPHPQAVGQKYHLTFKIVNADAKLVSQICHAHGFHEVGSSNTDYNLMWTGIHPKPHAFKSMLPHQRVNHFPRSYELTRKDRLYQNIERLQHSKGRRALISELGGNSFTVFHQTKDDTYHLRVFLGQCPDNTMTCCKSFCILASFQMFYIPP